MSSRSWAQTFETKTEQDSNHKRLQQVQHHAVSQYSIVFAVRDWLNIVLCELAVIAPHRIKKQNLDRARSARHLLVYIIHLLPVSWRK